MGGVDKGLQLLRGRPMAAWVAERLASQAATLLVSANRNGDVYAQFGRIVPDRIAGFVGPLAGIHAGLAACETPLLVSVPCDAPSLPLDLVARLHEGLEKADAAAAIACAGGRVQPVFALIKREALGSLAQFLASGGRSANAWFASLSAAVVDFPDADAFANINTREELDQASAPPA